MREADDPGDEIERALEILSVSINGVMSAYIDAAATPPKGEDGYLALASELEAAGADIVTLARAMEVLARRFPEEAKGRAPD